MTQLVDQFTTGFTFTIDGTLTTMKSLDITSNNYQAQATGISI